MVIIMMMIITELITTIKTIIAAIMVIMLRTILYNNKNTMTIQMLFSNKPYQPEIDLIENKHLPGLLMSRPGSLHVTVYNII